MGRVIQPYIVVTRANTLTEPLRQYLEEWFHREFENNSIEHDKPRWYALARFENIFIGRCGILNRKIMVGNHPMRVSGISGLTILPEWRRMGIANLILNQAETFITQELKTEYSLLICRDETAPFYLKRGWERIDSATYFAQNSGMYRFKKTTMIFRCVHRQWPPGDIDLCGLPW